MSLERVEEGLRAFLSWAVALLLAAIAVICFIEVLQRPFGASFVWYDEFVGYLLVWLTFFGAVLARSHHQHIGVENLLDQMSRTTRRWLVLATHVLMLLIHLVLLVYGAQLVTRFLSERTSTIDVPMGLVYSIVPISALLMLLVEAIQMSRLLKSS